MKLNSELNKILTGLMNTNESTNYSTLEDIPCFKEYFLNHLRVIWKTSEENLETRYKKWCKDLSQGKAWIEVRRGAVYGLWFHCELKQYEIAKLLSVSIRTIRRDQRYLEQAMYGNR